VASLSQLGRFFRGFDMVTKSTRRHDSSRPYISTLTGNAQVGARLAIGNMAGNPAQSSLRGRLLAHAGPMNDEDHGGGNQKPSGRNAFPDGNRYGAELFYHQSLKALQLKNVGRALDLIARACSGASVPAEYHRLNAEILRQCSQLDAALAKARLAVELDGRSANAWDTLGAILAERKELCESKHCYENAISLDPDLVESRHNLANVLQLLGSTSEAEFHYREVLKRAPHNALARVNFACLLNVLGRYREAWAIVEDLIGGNADFPKAHLIASAIENNQGQYRPALEQIEKAIALAPGQIRILIRRAEILCKLGRYQAALADCGAVLERLPADAEALRVKAFVLRTIQRPEEALVALHSAQSASPDPDLVVDRAWILAEMGQKGEALQLLDQTLSEQPDFAIALYYRAFLARHEPSHPDVAAMERIADNAQAPGKDRVRLSFALGKIHLDAGDGEKAFSYLNRANALKRASITYDRHSEERWFTGITELFSPENMAHLSGSGIHTSQPIFVFGMPRSGTTLVEQILASHPLVRAKGETPYLDMFARSFIFLPGPSGLSADNLKSCANRYLESVGAGQPSSLRFVDKTTSNYLYAGLISILLPSARMIHCRRDALDTCLSCYSLLFGHGHEFSYSQVELGHYYGLYNKTMMHWSTALPGDAMLHVDYEELVTDAEEQIQRILHFCGLPWDDACLRFYETKRLVTTSSLDQVRSPIYRTSMGRARMFRPWLGLLEQSLKENAA
jgi:tetratricopeptide (TPR) repeat protein